ncbi:MULTISPECIES: glycosyltransferase family 4 protein [unclassified Nostoc]|uniref:glycosyltransferase family 4 protein n=1 Tax=unclassified Nostoc TaxID=2593658 RepID=UPI002AD42F0D|nr:MULTISPECIES: glycosyltransferase family 4 protein [unclassified Nostoc]MDZ8125969.1 glycosyltransferase family 4 protein [Nostoc sp. CmiVER01]MDZ8225835.1 glycosyltransferase family 4 protein [Nostoc sp. ChiVER01]
MKISIVVGGRWHAFDLARELHSAGVLHRLITNYPKYKTRKWGIPDDKVVSLPLTLLLGKAMYHIGKENLVMKSQALLHNLFSKAASRYLEGSTVVHGWSSFSEPALHWTKRNNIPFLLERSSSHMKVQCQLLREEYKQLGLHWTETHPEIVAQELREYEMADKVAVPSLFVKRSFIAQGFPEKRLVLNHFGTNIKSFSSGLKQDNLFRIIYAGSLSVRKGIYYLVKAFREADISNSELCLVGGATTETPHLITEADKRIKLIGHVPQLQLVDYYRNSSVFVMASIEEGLAYVQAQALACGLPLICTTNTGGEDLLRMSGVESVKLDMGIEEYPAGYLVPVRNSEAIAICLKNLANNSQLLQAKREAALAIRNVSTGLDWSSYTQRAIATYENLHNPQV